MPRQKITWYIRLADTAVNWACFTQGKMLPRSGCDDWARMALLRLVAPDGRPLEVILTPDEARDLGKQLIQVSDALIKTNTQMGNGHVRTDPGEGK